MHLRLLGTPDLRTAEGRTVQSVVAQPKRLALLAYLAAAEPGGAQPRERLLSLFWPESDEAHARNSLSQSLTYLRRSLGEDVLLGAGAEAIAIDPARLRCDAVEFQTALAAGRQAEAVELFGGDFMDAFHVAGLSELERWVAGERARLREAMLGALLDLAAAAERDGQLAAAAARVRRGLALAPADERFARRLIRLLALQGDRAGALGAYEEFRSVLAGGFGLEPGPETERLAAELRDAPPSPAPEPARVAPPAPASGPSGPRPSTQRRRRHGAVVLAGASILVVATVLLAVQREAPAVRAVDDRRVEVSPFDNLTGDPALDGLERVAADWISQGLAQTGELHVPPVGLDVWSGDSAASDDAAPAPGFRVHGTVHSQGDSLRFSAIVMDADGRRVGTLDPVMAPATEPLAGIERVRQQVMATLSGRFNPEMAAWGAAARAPTSFAAYQEFSAGMESFVRRDYTAAHRHYMAAARLDPGYALPLLWAVFAYGNAGMPAVRDSLTRALEPRRPMLTPFETALLDHHIAYSAKNPEGRYRGTQRLVRIAPASEWLYLHALNSRDSNRWFEAVETLLRADPDRGWLRGDFGQNYWSALTHALHGTGQHARQLEAAREGLRRYPNSPGMFERLIGALAVTGRVQELDSLVGTAPSWTGTGWQAPFGTWIVEAEAHGHPGIAARLAKAYDTFYDGLPAAEKRRRRFRHALTLWPAGKPDEAARILGAIVADYPEVPHYRTWLAVVAAELGDGELALQTVDWLEEQKSSHEPRFTSTELSLYQFYVLTAVGAHDRAVARLRTVFEDGDLAVHSVYATHARPVMRAMWSYTPFLALVRPKDAPPDMRWPPWGNASPPAASEPLDGRGSARGVR